MSQAELEGKALARPRVRKDRETWWQKHGISLAAVLVFLALWQLSGLFLNPILLSTPVAVIRDWFQFALLHEGGLLSEHEFWPGEAPTRYEDSTFLHGDATFWTPPLVETTELCGPIALTLYASSSDQELLLFATLLLRDREGVEHELTRGWLRASQRELDPESPRWAPRLLHRRREPLIPGNVYGLRFPLVATARRIRPGEQLGIRIKSADDEPAVNRLQQVARGGLWRQTPTRVTLYHDPDHPSELLLPVTRGNVIGTFLSGGFLPNQSPGGEPMGKIDRAKQLRD